MSHFSISHKIEANWTKMWHFRGQFTQWHHFRGPQQNERVGVRRLQCKTHLTCMRPPARDCGRWSGGWKPSQAWLNRHGTADIALSSRPQINSRRWLLQKSDTAHGCRLFCQGSNSSHQFAPGREKLKMQINSFFPPKRKCSLTST